LYQI
jgi:hypothetical protein